MYLLERIWATAMSVVNIVSLSPLQHVIDNQSPLQVPSQVGAHLNTQKRAKVQRTGCGHCVPMPLPYHDRVGVLFDPNQPRVLAQTDLGWEAVRYSYELRGWHAPRHHPQLHA